MDVLGTGLVLVFNGLLELGDGLLSWQAAMAVAGIGSAWWLARMEVAEVDRSATKPVVRMH